MKWNLFTLWLGSCNLLFYSYLDFFSLHHFLVKFSIIPFSFSNLNFDLFLAHQLHDSVLNNWISLIFIVVIIEVYTFTLWSPTSTIIVDS